MNVKAASRDDVLAAHRVPPQLMGAMPGEKSAFGDVEKAARVYAINELMPVMEAMKHINDWLGEEVIRFNSYALLDEKTAPVMGLSFLPELNHFLGAVRL
ncbi:phage portal family protein [Escherichia coli]|nr:phage portal family protein [Escherichia coli]